MAHATVTVYGLAGPDGKIMYVGQTVRDLKQRLGSHRFYARRGDELPLFVWMREVGLKDVTAVPLEECPYAERFVRERHWINELGTSLPAGGCNVWVKGALPARQLGQLADARARIGHEQGGGGFAGHRHSDESRAKIRAAQQRIQEQLDSGEWHRNRGQ